ncbi:hypothetical protein EIP86_002552 [Pleurotus ostreatoroseus]|nr:hypothetical protein EIP86_002552 [Pleurotus ostreatoroseus]
MRVAPSLVFTSFRTVKFAVSQRLSPPTTALTTTSHRQYAKPASRDSAAHDSTKQVASGSRPSAGWSHPISSSEAITVHKSGFQGHAATLTVPPPPEGPGSLESLFDHLTELYPRTKRATHCMYAWRAHAHADTPKSSSHKATGTGSTSVGGSVQGGSCDGCESGAGERLERLLELSGCEDVVVVVYRWYGGVQLGSERWKCISGVAKEALRNGGYIKNGAERGKGKDDGKEEHASGKKGKKKR